MALIILHAVDLAERARKREAGSLVVLLLAEREPSEGPRSTRAFEDRPGYPRKRTGGEGGMTI
ncbi:MAG: hypothetical protein OJF47_003493 [Nitrospira sp.]|nr:MAG: hypothetical protein OJF47_003493 [Nitrospira sp.]